MGSKDFDFLGKLKNAWDLYFSKNPHLILILCGSISSWIEEIFSDLFSKSNTSHKEVVVCLADGPKDLMQICKELEKSQGGTYSKHLDDLVKAGFVQRDFTWHLDSGKESKLSRYRLSDNYLRFYMKYIAPNHSKIEKGLFSNSLLSSLPAWDSIMGLQFVNLVSH